MHISAHAMPRMSLRLGVTKARDMHEVARHAMIHGMPVKKTCGVVRWELEEAMERHGTTDLYIVEDQVFVFSSKFRPNQLVTVFLLKNSSSAASKYLYKLWRAGALK